MLAGLLFVAAGYLLFVSRSGDRVMGQSGKLLQDEIRSLEAVVLQELEDSTTLFRSLDKDREYEIFLERNAQKPYSILVYQEGELVLWSDNEVIPVNINRIFKQTFNFVKLNNGYYEVIRKDYGNDIIALGIIPVYYIYPLENQYLEEGFAFEAEIFDQVKIASDVTPFTINSYDGETLFHYEQVAGSSLSCHPLLWWIQVFGLMLIFAGIVRCAEFLAKRSNIATGIGFMGTGLILMVAMHYTPYLLYTAHTDLFSASIYASSQSISSLGILLVYSIACLAFTLFANRHVRFPRSGYKGVLSDIYILLLYVFNAILFMAVILIIKSVVDNSTISFDFYNFYTLSGFSMAGLAVFAIWFAILFTVCNKTAVVTANAHPIKLAVILGVSALMVYSVAASLTYISAPWITFFYLLVVGYFLLVEARILKFNFINYLLIVSFFSWTTAHIITTHISSKQFDKQKDFISELLFERDLSEEFQLMESGSQLLSDNFIKRYFINPFLSDYRLEEELKSKYFQKFESRYNINVYAFNNSKLPLAGESEKAFDYLHDLYRNKAINTVSSNIRYFSASREAIKYLVYYPVYREEDALGHVFVEIVPKVFGSSSAYPELLIASSQQSQPAEDAYEYAIYNEGKLTKSKGDYEYTSTLNFDVGEIGEYIFYNDQDYHHLVYNNDGDTYVVLSNKKRSIISPFSAFSYTFCFYLLVLLAFWIFGLHSYVLVREQFTTDPQPVTLQRRIQVSMISLVLSSLFIIGVVTLIYFQNQYNSYHNARLLRKANTLVKSLNAYVKDTGKPDFTEVEFEAIMRQRIMTLAKIHSLDLNVYRADGKLMITSQPDIFNKELVSNRINPFALLNLQEKGKSRHVQDEDIGKLVYLSAYLPYANEEGKTIAYLHFPYYSKQQSFRADISYFLVALVNVYVLLILTATAIALLLSRSITNSLTIIKERLSMIKLREKNIPIEWKNKDEIGMLVEEYNRMIVELEKSAELLARSERETAWREMAKQVAHEIKNPLTPMKLSIQHLQRALKEGRSDTVEMTEQVSNRLIEQIDHLNYIASEFSSFASMPIAQLQQVDLKEIVNSTAALFTNLQHLTISTDVPDHACYINADKNQMLGVFNNLLKNASQAISEERDGKIEIRLIEKEDVYRVEVEDNGVGIPLEKRAKVFEPNFTTKSSGTGLGLAISRNIIEKSKGNIWFESEIDKGTIFYLVLPKFEDEDQGV